MKLWVVAFLVVGAGACAGRAPAPVAVVQPQDTGMDCAALQAETEANNQKVQSLADEQGWKVAQNVVAGTAGLLIPILWFGMDFQGAAGKEAEAIQARQRYLAVLAGERCARPPPERRRRGSSR